MREREALWRAAARVAAAGEAAALATVARRRGSLPMASDAKMLVRPDGTMVGTVGGGCLEADVKAEALAAVRAGAPAVVRHTLNADVAGDLGLSCGGTVELFLEPVPGGAAAAALYQAAADALASRRPATVTTALDWTGGPRKAVRTGSESHVLGAWPDGVPDAALGDAAGLDEARGLFVEPVPRIPRLILFGAGHVGCEIARAAARTEFHVVMVDDRAEFANRERLPDADEVVVADLRVVLDGLAPDEDDYIIACTRGHAMDALVIERTAASRARYVGMLGSRRKRAVIWKALATAGVPQPALDRVQVPIGVDIGADTPAEIAIAVLAELIRLRRSAPEASE